MFKHSSHFAFTAFAPFFEQDAWKRLSHASRTCLHGSVKSLFTNTCGLVVKGNTGPFITCRCAAWQQQARACDNLSWALRIVILDVRSRKGGQNTGPLSQGWIHSRSLNNPLTRPLLCPFRFALAGDVILHCWGAQMVCLVSSTSQKGSSKLPGHCNTRQKDRVHIIWSHASVTS